MKWVEVDGRRTLINNPDYTARVPSVDKLIQRADNQAIKQLQQQFAQAESQIKQRHNDEIKALSNQYNIRRADMKRKWDAARAVKDYAKANSILDQQYSFKSQCEAKVQALNDKYHSAKRELKTTFDTETQKMRSGIEQRNLRIQTIRQLVAEGTITDPAVALQAEYKLFGIDIPLSALR